MSGRTQGPIPKTPPRQRRISVRSVVLALDGAERPYDVYRFSRRPFYERPRNNPFKDIPPDP